MKSIHSKITAASLLVTLGIVFGDIGTSPLYVMTAILGKNTITEELVLGGLSCIVWTLTLQATFKYMVLTLQADNHGEGGIFSLYALIRRMAPKWAIYVAMVGCSALLADGIITPSISLTASIEGLKIINDNFPVVPSVIIILIGLFTFQQFGTERVGKSFGPIMLVWFSMLTFWGLLSMGHDWGVIKALNPYYAYHILTTHQSAWLIVGAVFLCVTGAEALYSDLGHVGKTNIRITWGFVKTSLIINYFGQGAWALTILNGQTLQGANPFFEIMPKWFVIYGVIIAVMASVVASQALISGSFSLINEAVKLDTWFRVLIRYPSRYRQQLFIPLINHILFVGAVFIVLYFRESRNMEAAYGIAITIAMLATTLLLVFFLRRKLHWSWIPIGMVTSLFLSIEGLFFVGNVQKIAHGAGITLLLMTLFFLVMIIHYQAKHVLLRKRKFVDVHQYEDIITAVSEDKDIPKFATNIVYLTSSYSVYRMEKQILKSIYQKQPKRADAYWLLHFNETESPFQQEYNFHEMVKDKIFRIDFNLGYKVKPNVREMFTSAVEDLSNKGIVNLTNRYDSLKKYDVDADFLFIVMRNTLNLDSDSPIIEIFLLNAYGVIQKIEEPPEQYLGIDRNSLLVEYIALK
ncbi:MAG: KUP/HAK/KT family potassium transporter [Saprospiraceae bacterium]|uniref:KUP/HAK/KT family potassium transporter n=1 Tax=Candidatus Opimibacter skivensis TaxID=2982028 RepID=A0A9D7XPK7_9BACT|nr:KUP/HAK/KT family potassium transporter [Candidatus Opimibacter skivensis]